MNKYLMRMKKLMNPNCEENEGSIDWKWKEKKQWYEGRKRQWMNEWKKEEEWKMCVYKMMQYMKC